MITRFAIFATKSHEIQKKINFFQKKCAKPLQISNKAVTLHSLKETNSRRSLGEMVEWSITAVLKTAVPRGTGGSNPSLSA